MTLPQYSPTGITDMAALNKRARLCLILFGIALGIAIASFVGAVLLAYSKNYPAGIVLGVVSIICFYCAPIYYNNAAKSKAYARILSALDEGAESIDELSEKTGIRNDICKKLFEKAFHNGIIIDYVLSDGKITRK